jgi:hypothetical protein
VTGERYAYATLERCVAFHHLHNPSARPSAADVATACHVAQRTALLVACAVCSTLDDGPRTHHLPAGGVRIVGIPMTVCAVPALDDMEVRYADESESDAVFAAVGGPFYDEGEHLLALLGSTPEGVGFVTPQRWVIAPYEMSYGVEVGILAWERADDDDELGAPVRVVSMPADVMVVP